MSNRKADEEDTRRIPRVVMGMGMPQPQAAEVDISRLPVMPNDGPENELQDAEGNFYFMEGYSDPNGPDIPRPAKPATKNDAKDTA